MPRYLGQHFLVDDVLLQRIVDAISVMLTTHTIAVLREI
jgi:16S rRNA A1518/A1519 N6-dimethyltransferase RsmA/KsgA/DIM1 with predicted DNA glycosylase/AP lyase activity